MIFSETRLAGAFVIEMEPLRDDRGFFARTWCAREFAEKGLASGLAQCSISFNPRVGTLRGMHFQTGGMQEAKVVRCTRGRIFDVMLDLRADSPTFGEWHAEELSGDGTKMLYIPEGFAHGFQTLDPDSEIHYQISQFYEPGSSGGVRWSDPALAIPWPLSDVTMSQRDREWPLLSEAVSFRATDPRDQILFEPKLDDRT